MNENYELEQIRKLLLSPSEEKHHLSLQRAERKLSESLDQTQKKLRAEVQRLEDQIDNLRKENHDQLMILKQQLAEERGNQETKSRKIAALLGQIGEFLTDEVQIPNGTTNKKAGKVVKNGNDSSLATNRDVSQKRAGRVMNALMKLGVPAEKILQNLQMTAAPLTTDPARRHLNRRVTFSLAAAP